MEIPQKLISVFLLTFLVCSFSFANGIEVQDTIKSHKNDSVFKDIEEILFLVSDYVKEKEWGVMDVNPDLIEKSDDNDTSFWYSWPEHNGWSIFYWGDSVHVYNTYPAKASMGTEIRIDFVKKDKKYVIKQDKKSIVDYRR